jgi:hypothetical protein
LDVALVSKPSVAVIVEVPAESISRPLNVATPFNTVGVMVCG